MSEAAVRFESVTKSFGGRRVLDEVSFEIPRATSWHKWDWQPTTTRCLATCAANAHLFSAM
jgi:predicted RNA methylase